MWLLVSPGNPLKPSRGMAPLAERLAGARRVVDGRRIVATDIERHLHTRYTADTLTALRRRFPHVQFVWLMGADNLSQMPHWQSWMGIARTVPMAVHPRPSYNERALAGQAALRLRRFRRPTRCAPVLAAGGAPRWIFLSEQQTALSATLLRSLRATSVPDSRYTAPTRAPNAAPAVTGA